MDYFRAVLKRSKNFRPSAVRRPPSDNALRRPTPLRPTDRPTIKNFSWHCPCPTSDVRPGANTVGSILYDVYPLGHTNVPSTHFIMNDRNNKFIILGHACKFALKCFALKRSALKCFALKCFALKCFAPKCKYRIGLTPLYWHQGGRQTGTMSGKAFYGRTDGRTADGRQKET